MALLTCPDCGNNVSDLAASCPHCGRPVSTIMPPQSEPSPPPSSGSTPPSTSEPNQPHLVSSEIALASSSGEHKTTVVGGSPAIFVMVLIAIGFLVIIAKEVADRPIPDNSTIEAQVPLSTAKLFEKLLSERAAGRPEVALRCARELIASDSSTPEAKRAADLLSELEAAVGMAQKEADSELLSAKWSYSANNDPMTSRKARYASIESENALSFSFPYQGEQHGRLLLRDHPSHGRDVIILINKGQILCPSYDGCTVRVRFDEGKPQNWAASGPSDNSTTEVFLRNEGGFIQKLRNSKVVRVEIPVYQEGQPTLEFQVDGFDYSLFRKGE